MVDTRVALQLDGVRETIREPLALLVARLQAGLGDNLKSVNVVGSSLTQDFEPHTSDINTVVLVDAYDLLALNAVAAQGPSMSRYRLAPPLLMTPSYIDRSRDVFGVEFLDFQLIHETILGEDPFVALRFEKTDVRLQCERELKALLVRLRQGYIAAAGDKRMVRDLLTATAKGLAPLLRAMLWLNDADRPKTMEATLRRAATEFRVEEHGVLAAHHWRQEKPRLTDAEMESAFWDVLHTVDRLTAYIDGFEV